MDNPQRKNIRLKDYDYSTPGAYFITICTENRKSLFWNGDIDITEFYWNAVEAFLFARKSYRYPISVKPSHPSLRSGTKHTLMYRFILML